MSTTCRFMLECIDSKEQVCAKKAIFVVDSADGPNGAKVLQIRGPSDAIQGSCESGVSPCGKSKPSDLPASLRRRRRAARRRRRNEAAGSVSEARRRRRSKRRRRSGPGISEARRRRRSRRRR